jgi:HEAT repeat protein
MPSFVTVPFLLTVIVIGSAVALTLLLVTVLVRISRYLIGRHKAQVESGIRGPILRAIAGEGVHADLITARGSRGRAVERLAFGYLARVRGDGHDLLADLLERRGVVSRVIRRSSWPGHTTRAVEANRLGLIATPEAERRLERMAAEDRSVRVRIVAARGLGKTSTPHAAETLLSMLGQADLVPPGIVASALLELGPEAVPALRRTVRSGYGEDTGDAAASGDGQSRAMAADLLGLLDVMPAWEDLVACLHGPDTAVRVSAVRALGRLGVPQACDAISKCLVPDEDAAVRAEAAQALARIGHPSSVGPLVTCLGATDYWVAHNAAAALAALGSPGRQALARAAAVNAAGAAHAREALAAARVSRPEAEPALPGEGGMRP